MDGLPPRDPGHAAASRPAHRVACFAGAAGERTSMSAPLLELCACLPRPSAAAACSRAGAFAAVDDVSFALEARRPEIFTIIGESGSGKTTLSRA